MDEILIKTPDLGPKIRRIMDDPHELSVIESAPVCKTEQALLSWMMSCIFKTPGIHIWCSQNPRIFSRRMAHWIKSSISGSKKFAETFRNQISFPTMGSRVIFCEHDDLETQDVDRVGNVVITDAHVMESD